ncbi:stalk domain-containing protein [Paenibacillus sp. P36]|uniref:stalk domain-containing protein n=1 Tax=Paenibacillus sp. P36 TaxID=3342538 RepID=UPI0038B242FD
MIRITWIRWGFILTALFTLFVVTTAVAHAATVKKIQLYATDGNMTLADGNQVYIWGYSLQNKPGTAVFPGPKIEVEEGDSVEVTVMNIGPEKAGADFQVHSLHVVGVDDQAKASPALSVGQSDTRLIHADQAGSHFYYSYDPDKYGLQMGLNGPFIVKAKGSVNQAWTHGPRFDKEYVFHMNEIDPDWHTAVEGGNVYDRQKFHPRFWTINGKSYPDVETDPASMVHGRVGEKILVRLINPGFDEHPMHLHGHHFQVIAENGVPLPLPIDKDTVAVDPGETKDILIVFDQSGHFPFHSHKILDNTNDGVYPGGLHTMTHIEEAGNANSGMISFQVGSMHAMVNGDHVMLDTAPFQLKGETYLPFELIADQFGGTLQALAEDRSYTYKTENTEMSLWLIQKQAIRNGQQIELPAPLLQVEGKAMVPLSVISTLLCPKVSVDGSTGTISIEYKTGQECQSPEHDGTTPVVTADPVGATYPTAQTVTLTITDNDPDAKIYYTVDGSTPSNASALYTSPIRIDKDTTLKFIGIDTSGNTSDVKTESYTIKPVPEVIVDVLNDKFSSAQITVKKGTKVTWVLKSSMMHTVTAYDMSFNGTIDPNGETRFSYTFTDVGTFGYFCMVHPFMTGSVVVEQ